MNMIKVKHGDVGRLAKALDCSKNYVSECLRGKYKNGKAPKIRHVALKEFNGVEMIVKPKEAAV